MKRTLIARLFPSLQDAEWGYINCNEIAADLVELLGIKPDDENPFLDPEYIDAWMGFVHKIKGIEYSWGGWLEDRAVLWRGHYHKPGETVHLGVDFNVFAGTEVMMPCWGKLVHSFQDKDQNGGWGGKLIFETDKGYLLFGHLRDIVTDIGTKYSPGEKIGVVAEADCNGGWGPHLHVQRMKNLVPDIDGYGKIYEGIREDFPDPMEC